MGSKRYRNGTSKANIEKARLVRRQQTRWRRRGLTLAGVVVAVALVIVAVSLRHDGGAKADTFAGTTIEVSLREFAIVGDLTAPTGNVRLRVTNDGGAVHNVGVRGGPITSDLRPGQTATLDLGALAAGSYELYCDVDDHTQRGMTGTLLVT